MRMARRSRRVIFSTTGGAVRQKPDLTAADGVAHLGDGIRVVFRNLGSRTSPAASIAALLKSYNPLLSSAQMRAVLTGTALDNANGRGRGPRFRLGHRDGEHCAAATAPPATRSSSCPARGLCRHRAGWADHSILQRGKFYADQQWLEHFYLEPGQYVRLAQRVTGRPGSLTSGAPAVTVTASLNVAATNLAAGALIRPRSGSRTWFGNRGQSRQFTLSVTQPPVAIRLCELTRSWHSIHRPHIGGRAKRDQPPPAGSRHQLRLAWQCRQRFRLQWRPNERFNPASVALSCTVFPIPVCCGSLRHGSRGHFARGARIRAGHSRLNCG